jgi:hypothetical protein
MKMKLKVDNTTTVEELALLGAFFTGLAGERSYLPPVFVAPTDEAELPPEPSCVTLNREEPVVHVEAPKRRRRTKAEIAAMAAVGEVVADGPFYWSHPESGSRGMVDTRAQLEAVLAGDPCCDEVTEAQYKAAGKPDPTPDPAPTQPAPEQDTPPSEPASSEPATESPSDTKTYTPAEVQKIAVATAGRFGPEKVKAIIAQYPGAARIADLPLGELAGFVAKLNAVS